MDGEVARRVELRPDPGLPPVLIDGTVRELNIESYFSGCSKRAARWKDEIAFDYRDWEPFGEIKGRVTAAAFRPNTNQVAYATWDGIAEVFFFDYINHVTMARYTSGVPIGLALPFSKLSFSIDGKYVAAVGSGVYVWDISRGELILKQPDQGMDVEYAYVQFVRQAEGEVLYIARQSRVEMLNPETGRTLGEMKIPAVGVGTGVLGPEGTRMLILPSKWQKPVAHLANLETGLVEWEYHQSDSEYCGWINACFHPTGKLVAIGEQARVTVWAVEQGNLISDLRFDRDAVVQSMAFSPDGHHLAVGLTVMWTIGSEDDAYVAKEYACDICDWEWGAHLFRLMGQGEAVAFSADGAYLAVGDGSQRLDILKAHEARKDRIEPPKSGGA